MAFSKTHHDLCNRKLYMQIRNKAARMYHIYLTNMASAFSTVCPNMFKKAKKVNLYVQKHSRSYSSATGLTIRFMTLAKFSGFSFGKDPLSLRLLQSYPRI